MLFNKNDKAVSPVVATLVLIVVAIIGAAAVGVLLGAFSSDVSEQASTGQTSAASSSEILIGGSTTVQPVSELLAEAFMKDNQGVKVTIQGGGSGAGVAGAEQGVLDIGSSSSTIDKTAHPDLQVFEIGGSAVVLIASNEYTGAVDSITSAQVNDAYANCDPTTGVTTTAAGNPLDGVVCYQRSEASGTEETFAKYISLAGSDKQLDSDAKGASGNAGVYSAVKGSDAAGGAIGFVDFGFYKDADVASVVKLGVGCTQAQVTGDEIKKSLRINAGASTETPVFPTGLCRNLYYCTLGTPSAGEQAFIDFAMSPGAIDYFHDAGYYSIYDYKA